MSNRKTKRKINEPIKEIVKKIPKNTRILGFTRLTKSFFNVTAQNLAINLLGKILVRKLEDNSILKGRIVETEAYLAENDKGSRTNNGRRTEATEPLYMPAGTAFVYMTYGMYFCFNISSMEPGAAVLLRALEPLENLEKMKVLRFKGKTEPKNFKPHMLCNGPSKLCSSMNIDKVSCNKLDLSDSNSNQKLWIEDDFSERNFNVVNTSRIGIDSVGEEWAKMPLRYYIYGNECVSKRDKDAEKIFDEHC